MDAPLPGWSGCFRPAKPPVSAPMHPAFARMSISTRRKLVSILLAVAIFALLAGLVTAAEGHSPLFGMLNAILAGTGVGLFEQFYVQSLRGRWMRNSHPLLSILIYTVVVVVLFMLAINLSHALLRFVYPVPVPYGRLPIILPIVVVLSVIGIVVMRVVHFIGIETLFHLTIGTYHRPVVEQKVLIFVDINNSTALAERLGALKIKSLVGKFLFDISKPITDHGGDIYLYKGDGLIAIWDWGDAVRGNRLLSAIDAVFAAVRRERPRYMAQFGVVPAYRIGVHGGDVVVSEQGDTKRSIGIYGSTINIASRMEEAAKLHGVACAISGMWPESFRTPMAACIKSALTGSKEFPPKSRFSNIGSGPRRVRRRPGAAGGRATADGRETRRRARLQRLAKGQIDPAGSGQRVLAPGERGDAVIDETRRAAPHDDVAILQPQPRGPVLAAEPAPQKHRRQPERHRDDWRRPGALVLVAVQRQLSPQLIAVDQASVGAEPQIPPAAAARAASERNTEGIAGQRRPLVGSSPE